MATCKDCKDCFHYELCGVFGYISPVECGFYTDRSRFVELPCRVSGDCFFINQNGTIQRATLERVYMFSTSTELFLNVGREIYNASLNELHIGLFPTYEEAEQAKERERK